MGVDVKILQAVDGHEPQVTNEEIGKAWRENSSLERWFPITAERIAQLEAENKRLRQAIESAVTDMQEAVTGLYGIDTVDGQQTKEVKRLENILQGRLMVLRTILSESPKSPR